MNRRRRIVGILLLAALTCSVTEIASAWPTVFPTGVTVNHAEKAEHGYVLFAPLESNAGGDGNGVLYLINTRTGDVAHRWSVPFAPLHGRLMPDGSVTIIGRNDKQAPGRPGVGQYFIGGAAGWLVTLDWDGKLLFRHVDLAMHHDFDVLESGNLLYLAWEPVPPELQRKVRGGIKCTEFLPRDTDGVSSAVMFNDKLVEIDPRQGGKVVWEWHANEHFDPDLDIIGPLYKRQEWYHGNSVAVLADGNIALTGRFTDSLIIIDRKTGKILRRWGNNAWLDRETGRIEYRAGDAPTVLGGPHDVRQIPAGLPGAGRLTVYDNGTYAAASRVVEIDPATGELTWQSPRGGGAIGRKHFSDFVAGAQRLPGGNTLVCDGANGRLFQITPEGETVWEYVSPYVPSPQYKGAIFKAHFYSAGYCKQLEGHAD